MGKKKATEGLTNLSDLRDEIYGFGTALRQVKSYFKSCSRQHSGQFLGEGLEKSYPPHKVRVYVKHGAPMDSLKTILAGLLTTAGHLANRSSSF